IITLGASDLHITKSITITGNGPNLLTITGKNLHRVFSIDPSLTVSISGMTITGGNGTGSIQTGGVGGGVLNRGISTFTNCVITGNTGTIGGGLNSQSATLTLTNCTISNNIATGFGGGIYCNGTLLVTGCTVTNNKMTGSGQFGAGGIETSGKMTLTN